MRILPIQSSMYRSASKPHFVSNVSFNGGKGFAKGAATGGAAAAIIAGVALASLPAALIIGGVTAVLSGVIGSEAENQNDSANKK